MNSTKRLLNLREELVSEIKTLLEDFEHIDEHSERYKPIYAKINHIEFRDNKFYLSGDLLTDKLIEFDYQYFNANEFHKGIKPIYFGFETTISLDSVWHKANPVTKIIYNYLVENKNNFSDYYRLIEKLDNYQDSGSLEPLFSAKDDNLFNTLFSIKYDKKYYKAMIYFSASPFKKYEKGIKFDKIKDDSHIARAHYSRIKELQNTDISNNLLQFQPSILREYNVGQGNFSELIDNNNQKIVFDPGMTYFDDPHNFNGAILELSNLDAECYFISHFDLDHILGTIYLQDSQFLNNKLWIVPKPTVANTTPNADRLIWYLYNNAKIRMIEDSSISNIFVFNNSINIYKGKATTKSKEHNSRYANGSGIMISAKGNNKIALLPGDCLYNYWSTEVLTPSGKVPAVNQSYDYLVVPHHGCKIRNISQITIKGNPDAEAIVPVGKEQRNYHHPNLDHIKQLFNNGFNSVYLTIALFLNVSQANINNLIDANDEFDFSGFNNKSLQDYKDFVL